MKIVHIERDLTIRSGSRRFICETTNYLQSLGHRVGIFTTKLDVKRCFPEFLSLPVEVVPIEDFRSRVGRFLKNVLQRNIDYHWVETKAILEISRRVADWEPDIVIFHYAGEHWLQPYFYHLKDSVGAVCLHVVPPVAHPPQDAIWFQSLTWRRKLEDDLLDLPPIKKWNTISLKKVGLIIAHSHYMLDQAMKQGLIGSRRAAVVPLGVDHSKFYPTYEEEPFALFLGRITPNKSISLAVRAMEKTGPDKSLIIAGTLEDRNLWYEQKLEKIAKRIGISDRFKIVLSPSDEQVIRLMQRCSVFLFPSTTDTFGVAVLEAMACGKPIVACRRGGVPELLDNCGFLLDPDVKQWQETVRKVFSNSNLRRETGKKAFERSKLYSWQNNTNSLLQTIENFLASKRTDLGYVQQH